MIGLASHAAEWRTPRKRPPPARMCACSTGSTRSPSARSANPTMPAAIRVAPYWPLALMAATPGDELRLADRSHLGGAIGAIHRVALQKHGGHHVVAGAQVGEQLVQQVPMIRADPQVMVRVDDRQVRLEDRLGRGLGQPRLVGRADAAVLGRARMGRLAHVRLGSVRVVSRARAVRVPVVGEAAGRWSGRLRRFRTVEVHHGRQEDAHGGAAVSRTGGVRCGIACRPGDFELEPAHRALKRITHPVVSRARRRPRGPASSGASWPRP